MNHFSDSCDNGDGSGDHQEPSSSLTEANVEDAITSFREQWQRELLVSPKANSSYLLSVKEKDSDNLGFDSTNTENEAKNLFLKGTEHEQNGKLYEAVQFYKRAVQLVPDIEFRLYESTQVKFRERFDADKNVENIEYDIRSMNEIVQDNEEDTEDSNLLLKLSKIINHHHCICFPKHEQSTTHISILPMEIVLYILRWVVSSELDIRSLEMFSRVCRGFYVSSRDSEIWRLACIRVWGINCGTYATKYQSWREMYLQRPRVRYNGCYISKTTYTRHGENSFQDKFYRPWYLVEYNRYLRFFPEGRVLMLTSTDDAQMCVNSLKHRVPRNPSILVGHYRLHDNRVTVVLKKQETKGNHNLHRHKKREPTHDSGEETYQVEFEIRNHHKTVNSNLMWLTYDIFTKYKSGQEVRMYLRLGARYPPFKFSRVRSYAQESEAPLQ